MQDKSLRRTDRDSLIGTAEKFLACLCHEIRPWVRDVDAILAMIADDFYYELVYPLKGAQSVFRTKPEVRALFSSMNGVVADMKYDVRQWVVDELESTVVTIMNCTLNFPQTGGSYSNRYVFVMKIREGKIFHWEEYFNPHKAQEAADLLG